MRTELENMKSCQQPSRIENEKNWGDLGDGTFRNPVINADYCDPDVIRVGNAYYMISSTANLCPGMILLKSYDLVHWETISHAITGDDLRTLAPEMNWDKMNRYKTGVYAGSLRYLEWRECDSSGKLVDRHRWFVHATLFLDGITVSCADDPEGPWITQYMVDKNGKLLNIRGWDDNCPYWEFNQDGTIRAAYMSASKPGSHWYIRIFRMSTDGMQLLDGDVEFMKIEGDTTRKRAGDTPAVNGLVGSDSGDPKGFVIDRFTGEEIPSSYGNPSLNINNEFKTIRNAIYYPGREGTPVRDIQTAEGSKILRFGLDTSIGKTEFNGRHGKHQQISDYIFLFNNEEWEPDSRFPVISRAKCIYGDVFDEEGMYIGPGTPEQAGSFETQRLLLNITKPKDTLRPNQGAFVDVPASMSTDAKEYWYFITQQGNEEVLAQCRPVNLLPVKWIGGWPMPGELDVSNEYRCMGSPDINASIYDGTGLEGNTSNNRHHPNAFLRPGVLNEGGVVPPIKGAPKGTSRFQGSDDFSREVVSPVWQWNHIPRDDFWSLKERAGFLRMYAFHSLDGTDRFFKVGNTICQRFVGSEHVQIEVKINIEHMANGQVCGICHFNGGESYVSIGVARDDEGIRRIFHSTGHGMGSMESGYEHREYGDMIGHTVQNILLRSTIHGDRINQFSYVLEGETSFRDFGAGYRLVPAGYKGDLAGIYTYNNHSLGKVGYDSVPHAGSYPFGFIDVEYFIYDF